MAYDLVRLYQLTDDDEFGSEADRQLRFMSGEAARAPMGCSFFLLALSEHADPPEHVVIVPGPGAEPRLLADGFPADALVSVLSGETEKYRLINGHTTYYVCKGHACLPPVNDPAGL